jgi:hypothetical protein
LKDLQEQTKGQLAFEEAKFKSGNPYWKIATVNPVLLQLLASKLAFMAAGREVLKKMMGEVTEPPTEETKSDDKPSN